MRLCIKLLLLSYSLQTLEYDGWKQVSQQPYTLPSAHSRMAIAYYNESISIIGDNTAFIQFNIPQNKFIDHGNYLSNESSFLGQSYTQIQSMLYMIDINGNYINTFNLKNNTFIYKYHNKSIPYDVGPNDLSQYACLTSFRNCLFIIGGTGKLPYVQILNLTSFSWHQGKPMKIGRAYLSCIAHPTTKKLYAIGGSTKSIEKLNITGNMNNILQNEWEIIYNMTFTLSRQRSVIYGNDILIIGGYAYNESVFSIDDIYVIDTKIDNVTIKGHLNYSVFQCSAIVVDQILYAFGGKRFKSGPNLDSWQYLILNTFTPTTTPTSPPTQLLITYVYTTLDRHESLKNISSIVTLYNYVLVSVILIFFVLIISGFIDSKFIHRNDVFKIGYIVIFGVYSLDFISDLFFSLTVFSNGFIVIFIASIVFMIVPVLLNMYQLYNFTNKWMIDPENGSFISIYMDNHTKFIYVLSVICGSGYATVKLLNSTMFRMKIFDMGLKRHQMTQFQSQRLLTVVALENVPQIGLHIAFTISNGGIFTGITMMALIFSIFSVIISIFEHFTKKSVIQSQTEILNVYVIEFDIISKEIHKKRKYLRYQRNILNEKIAELLKIDVVFVEQLRSVDVNGGLKLIFKIKIHTILHVGNMMEGLVSDGTVTDMIVNSWGLQYAPQINNLNTTQSKMGFSEIDLATGNSKVNSNMYYSLMDSNL